MRQSAPSNAARWRNFLRPVRHPGQSCIRHTARKRLPEGPGFRGRPFPGCGPPGDGAAPCWTVAAPSAVRLRASEVQSASRSAGGRRGRRRRGRWSGRGARSMRGPQREGGGLGLGGRSLRLRAGRRPRTWRGACRGRCRSLRRSVRRRCRRCRWRGAFEGVQGPGQARFPSAGSRRRRGRRAHCASRLRKAVAQGAQRRRGRRCVRRSRDPSPPICGGLMALLLPPIEPPPRARRGACPSHPEQATGPGPRRRCSRAGRGDGSVPPRRLSRRAPSPSPSPHGWRWR